MAKDLKIIQLSGHTEWKFAMLKFVHDIGSWVKKFSLQRTF